MKLEEKLMKLRKENAWSQEEFADKLNVTRQTVSKWELGQTTPDTDNLTKIASIFGISVNDLLDENTNPIEENSKVNNNNNGRPIKILLLIAILIVVFLGIGAITINKIFNKVTNQVVPKSIIEMFEQYSIADIFDMIFGKIQESEKEFDRNSFNNKFKTLYYGSTDGFFMNNFIDEVLKSNDEHPNNLITVKYKDIESNNANEIKTIKKQLKTGVTDKYEIYYEYDENGYINKAIIEDAEKTDLNSQVDSLLNGSSNSSNNQMTDFQKNSFNQTFKTLYYGSTDGFFMNNFIDAVIKSNEEHPEHIITVNYAGTETSDASELRNMKKKFTNGTTYEIIYEYDENGLINKAKIEK